MSVGPDYEPRAFLAVVGVGATACTLQFVGWLAATTPEVSVLGQLAFLMMVGVVTWFVAAIGFFAGMLFVGVPAWAAVVALGWTSRGGFAATGALLAALAGAILTLLQLGAESVWVSAAFLVLPGAAAGWALHRVAYGKTVQP